MCVCVCVCDRNKLCVIDWGGGGGGWGGVGSQMVVLLHETPCDCPIQLVFHTDFYVKLQVPLFGAKSFKRETA